MKSTGELPRRHGSDWQRTIASVREMLARLERASEGSDVTVKGKQSKAAAWVSSLVEKLVAAATDEIGAAVDQSRAEADVNIAHIQALVTHLQHELEVQRQEISRLQQRLETENARNTRLAAAFQAVQRVVSVVDPVQHAPPAVPFEPQRSEPSVNAASETQNAASTAAQTRPLKLVGPVTEPEANPELAEYVRQLFEQIESDYWANLKEAMGPADIVDRLTESLRSAHDMFGRRVKSANSMETNLFDQRLTTLLDSDSETSFGRHLAVAAYNCAPPEGKPKAGSVRAEAS